MKLSDSAKQMGGRYETAWRWFRDGNIQGRRIGPPTILIPESHPQPRATPSQPVAVYARVSSAENQGNLDSQAERLVAACAARGDQG
jgi:predicted site-specific integrase-resolvase